MQNNEPCVFATCTTFKKNKLCMVFGLSVRASEVPSCLLVDLKRNQHPEVHLYGMDAAYLGGQEMTGRKILPVPT